MTNAITANASSCGYSTSTPLPFSKMPREMIAKCFTGFTEVMGCSQVGIASIGVVAPESSANGGLVKKPINCACCCVRVKVAIIIPKPMPHNTHNEAARKKRSKLPRTGTPKTRRATPLTALTPQRSLGSASFVVRDAFHSKELLKEMFSQFTPTSLHTLQSTLDPLDCFHPIFGFQDFLMAVNILHN